MAYKQGGFRAKHNPGLKPWAIMYSRFAAKVRPLPTGQLNIRLGSVLVALNYRSGLLLKLFDRG
jgi:hypothetical protein